jgi:hypothetical protein
VEDREDLPPRVKGGLHKDPEVVAAQADPLLGYAPIDNTPNAGKPKLQFMQI